MRHLLFVSVALALGIGALPASTGHCAVSQAALRASQCCCGPSADDACAMACAPQEAGSQRHDLRAATTEPTLKTSSIPLAFQDLTAPVLMLASAGSSTATSPASVPRRYLLSHTLRL